MWTSGNSLFLLPSHSPSADTHPAPVGFTWCCETHRGEVDKNPVFPEAPGLEGEAQTWSQDLPFQHQPATRKASAVPISGAWVSLLKIEASPCPLRVGLEVQERGQCSPAG